MRVQASVIILFPFRFILPAVTRDRRDFLTRSQSNTAGIDDILITFPISRPESYVAIGRARGRWREVWLITKQLPDAHNQ